MSRNRWRPGKANCKRCRERAAVNLYGFLRGCERRAGLRAGANADAAY